MKDIPIVLLKSKEKAKKYVKEMNKYAKKNKLDKYYYKYGKYPLGEGYLIFQKN